MDRRAFVGAVAGGLAGCANPLASRPPPPPPIADQPCPPYAGGLGRVICSHTVERESALVYLHASPETAAVADGRPVEDVTLELVNRTDQPLRFNPAGWTLRRFADGGWTELSREQGGVGVVEVPPGGTHRWTFLEAAGLVLHEPSFDPGLYAAEIGIGWVTDPETYERYVVSALALVRLVRAA